MEGLKDEWVARRTVNTLDAASVLEQVQDAGGQTPIQGTSPEQFRDQKRTKVSIEAIGEAGMIDQFSHTVTTTGMRELARVCPRRDLSTLVRLYKEALPAIINATSLQVFTYNGLNAAMVTEPSKGNANMMAPWRSDASKIGAGSPCTLRDM